jgi:cytochrome P450
MNLVLLGRGEQAETALRDIADGPEGYLPDGHYWATVRAANLVWMLGKPADASAILDGLASPNSKAPETPAEVAERLAVQACLDAVAARCELAAERARAALYSGALPDFHAMMASLALIMAMGALGEVDDLAGVAEQALRRATTSFQASHMRFWFGAVYGRACRLTGRIDECVSTAKQLADSARDIPGLAYANLAHPLTDNEICDELVLFMLAGHDTTSTMLTYALWSLGHHRDIQEGVRAQVAALGDRVLHEALRLCPPAAGTTRSPTRDIVVDGYRVEAGTIAFVSFYAMHRDPALWEDPLRFDPDRFLPERSQGRSRWQYLPFGGGPRSCIGDHFAMLEATLALATIIRSAEIESLDADFPLATPFTVVAAAPIRARTRAPAPRQ